MTLRHRAHKLPQHIDREKTVTSFNVRRLFMISTAMMMLWGVAILTGL
jgi:hypothetical protein